MKNISIFLLTIIAFVGFTACEHDDDVVFTAQPDPEGVAFTSSFSSNYTLNAASSDNLAERFVWSEVDFGAPTTVTYELHGSASQDFSSFDVIGTTSETNLGVTIAQMISLAADAGLDNDATTEDMPNTGSIYFRVRAYAGTGGGNGLEEISEAAALNVTLPEQGEEEETKMNLFLVGDATAAGWDPDNNNTPLFRDSDNDNIFYFQGRFAGGGEIEGFKLLSTRGAWQPQWGLSEGNFTNSEILGEDPTAFTVGSDAYYSFSVNTEDMTYTFEEVNASSAATYDVIGLVGEGTSVGWPGDDNPTPDIQLTQLNFDEHIWYAESVTLTDGPLKFRANLAWDTSWGGGENFPSGQATGDDIMASAGTYEVWFNDLTGRYIFIPLEE